MFFPTLKYYDPIQLGLYEKGKHKCIYIPSPKQNPNKQKTGELGKYRSFLIFFFFNIIYHHVTQLPFFFPGENN